MKIISINKKYYHNYHVLEVMEAGIVLQGDEVKSVRAGNVSLNESFATIHDGIVTLINCHISPYTHAYSKAEMSRQTRTLLLHKKEINKLIGAVARKGLTLIPLRMYLNARGYVKIELGLAKHKNAADKKDQIRERDLKREAQRETKFKLR
jgi:SsrA-binding protein